VVYLAVGDSTPGRTGAIMRSRDAGATWEQVDMPTEPNSAMWTVTVPTPDPDLVFAASRFGQLYRSNNGGETWVGTRL
jgi:photosystem II stability/assembly factor-like uncharacterized protein